MSTHADEAIGRQVQQAIGFEPRVNGFDVRVDVRGGVARIEGIVDNLDAKSAAGGAAAAVPGVRRVENLLTVEDPRGLADPEIENAVEEALDADPGVDTREVGVRVTDGTAHLIGYADSLADEDDAVAAAGRAEGVTAVVSEVDISPGRDIDWTDLKNDVVDALDNARGLLPYALDVDVETGGRVVLTGELTAEADRQRVVDIVRRVEGVKDVVVRV